MKSCTGNKSPGKRVKSDGRWAKSERSASPPANFGITIANRTEMVPTLQKLLSYGGMASSRHTTSNKKFKGSEVPCNFRKKVVGADQKRSFGPAFSKAPVSD